MTTGQVIKLRDPFNNASAILAVSVVSCDLIPSDRFLKNEKSGFEFNGLKGYSIRSICGDGNLTQLKPFF